MYKIHCFHVLSPFSWAIAQFFWSSGTIYKAHDTQYMFERHDQNLIIFELYGCFRELFPTVCGSSTIYKPHDSWYMFEINDQK
jgi:hypothetical protein